MFARLAKSNKAPGLRRGIALSMTIIAQAMRNDAISRNYSVRAIVYKVIPTDRSGLPASDVHVAVYFDAPRIAYLSFPFSLFSIFLSLAEASLSSWKTRRFVSFRAKIYPVILSPDSNVNRLNSPVTRYQVSRNPYARTHTHTEISPVVSRDVRLDTSRDRRVSAIPTSTWEKQ